jgi:hypothetical protein
VARSQTQSVEHAYAGGIAEHPEGLGQRLNRPLGDERVAQVRDPSRIDVEDVARVEWGRRRSVGGRLNM